MSIKPGDRGKKSMAYKIKLSHQRRPRGLAVLVGRADRADRQAAEMRRGRGGAGRERRALAGAEREGVRLRAEKGRAAEHLAGSIAEHERAEAESELAFYDAQTATEKAVELDAENVAALDHVGGLLDALHTDLDSLEADLDAFIKGGK